MKRVLALVALVPVCTVASCGSGGGSGAGPGGSDGGGDSSSSGSDTGSATDTGAGGPTRDGQADSGEGGITLGTPIIATAGQWTWIPFPDAFCADGSTTGLGVNLSTASTRVLIYMEGGGACWDELTCYTLMTAANFTTGYSQAQFTAESTDAAYLAEPGGFFDRSATANPFKDYSYVYVPYCTGDMFAGDNVATLGTHTAHFVGFANMTAYLRRIVPTFPTTDRVYLAGSSAGGMGAIYDWWQTQSLFGSVRVDLIDDSGTFMPTDIPVQYQAAQNTAWSLAATTPPGCSQCATDCASLYPLFAAAAPGSRGALLSFDPDSTLPSYYGITTAQFQQGLGEVTANDFTPHPNLKYFLSGRSGHVLWFQPTLATGAVTLQQFLTLMVTDSLSWTSVHP